MDEILQSEVKKSCESCGAELTYAPGSDHIQCAYCGYEAFINAAKNSFEELELRHYLETTGEHRFTETVEILHCKNCGANQNVQENFKSLSCVYCGEPLIREDSDKELWIRPGALVPFQLTTEQARRLFRKWVQGLWFAPGAVKRAALDPEGMHGLYLPFWTFDAQMEASYRGQRGDYYYETKRVRTKDGVRTQQVRKTRWTPASGKVSGFVDDILILAASGRGKQLPQGLFFWDLKALKPFHSDYLSGFVTEKYTLSLKDGHHQSFKKAKEIARTWIRRDIGGDTQRILDMDIGLDQETFKHILLPIYISSYRYKGKEYSFYVNGQTGKVHGSRPYSFWKIFLTVVGALLIFALLIFVLK
ncbi:zinc finger domain-containing protein, LSD1 subclass [Robiginitalea myxolifaciens]|uniref:Zinc finger domain-containing protein, LSD1 subclass n=1 Tax=Robiginitalea myxolifaciens TaxID=400055 RepID=A0A1I6G5N0_9FLAO|nr:DNA helicase PriA [Robiginitalea myxolifaciens]SFR37504.1 zinc finger domain-containing protein, LSD1 subclass [Robiginitalea myxolifaciens]